MNIYLKWNAFNISTDYNFSIFDLEISQEENYFAKACLIIDARASLPPPGTEGLIWEGDEERLFKGSLVGTPVKIEGDFAEIELIAKPLDFSEKVAVLQKENRVFPYWDGLWVKSEKHADFQEIQDVRASSLYCDRRTGDLSSSNWFEGRQKLSIHQNFFHDSLSVKRVGAPLKACTVKVHAHWIQSESGASDVSSAIRRAFPHFKVSTYTKKALLEKWPEPGQRLGRSGLWAIKSDLKPMVPSSPLYPKYSPSLALAEEGEPIKSYRVKRHWFKPALWIGWQFHQKRKETLIVTLFHSFQPLFPEEVVSQTLEFTLQNINPDPKAYPWQPASFYREGTKTVFKNRIYRCKSTHTSRLSFEEDQEFWVFKKLFHTPLGNPARTSFFLTERGYQAAEHAMERAKVVLAKSARCLEVSVEGSWEKLKNITTDTSVTLSDPRLPGGRVTGKVVKYALIAKGETGERLGRITLLCAVGTGNVEKTDGKPIPSYALEDYCEDTYQAHAKSVCQTPSGLSYFRYDDTLPPERVKRGPLVRGVELINGPQEQETEMLKHTHQSPSTLKKALFQKPTQLRMYFKDLRTKEKLEHVIPVTMASSWSAPRQVGVGR